jgi:beta propeller repeat protein
VRGGIIAALLVLAVGTVAAAEFETFPIERASRDQTNPAVDDCTVVWQDDRNGDWDIGVADLSSLSGISTVVYADPFSQSEYPAISGDIVVWQNQFFLFDERDIVGLDLSKDRYFDVMVTLMDECCPAISGLVVVADVRMTEHADWDVVGVDLGRPGDLEPFAIDLGSGDQWHVDISGSIVVYEDTWSGTADISGRDLSDPRGVSWFPIFGGEGSQQRPAVSGKWAVWQDDCEGAWALGGDDLFHPRLPEMVDPDGTSDHEYADVYNNVVVWQDQRNGNWDIYGRNLTSGEAFQITDNSAEQIHPAITFSPQLNGYVVVWQDRRNGTWDIYGAFLDGPEVAGCASPLRWDVNADSVVDVDDQDAVEGNLGRRNGIPPSGN